MAESFSRSSALPQSRSPGDTTPSSPPPHPQPQHQHLLPPPDACARAPSPRSATRRPPQPPIAVHSLPPPPPRTQAFPNTRCLHAALYKNECGRGRGFGLLWAPCLGQWGRSYSAPFPEGAKVARSPCQQCLGSGSCGREESGRRESGVADSLK